MSLDTNQALLTIKKLVEDNESTLVNGIIVGSAQRKFEHITTSSVTPPTGYYFLAIDAEPVNLAESEELTSINVRIGRTDSVYGIVISVVDYIYGIPGDDELFETMHSQFRTVCDRLQQLLHNQEQFISPDATHRYTHDGEIVRQDLATTWQDAESYQAVVATEIRFELTECIVS